MSNTSRTYRNNMSGISCSLNKGRINITANVMDYLGSPSEVSLYQGQNPDLLYIVAGRHEDSPLVVPINTLSSPTAYIAGVDVVREIYSWFNISRRDNDVMSPFFDCFKTHVNDAQAVRIVMNHFSDYR